MEERPKVYVAYCVVCKDYVFMTEKEQMAKVAAERHVEKTHHRVIVGYEIYEEPQKQRKTGTRNSALCL